jgi:hypothetical protein
MPYQMSGWMWQARTSKYRKVKLKTYLPSKITVLTLLLASLALPIRADQTNLLRTLQIQLLGVKQGDTTVSGSVTTTTADPVSVGSRDVIRALGEATGNTFSRDARLVVVTPLVAWGGYSTVEIRDGATKLNVTSFFSQFPISDPVTSAQSNSRTGRSSSTQYSIQEFVLLDHPDYPPLSLHFNIRGVSVENTLNSSNGYSTEMDATGAGRGDRNGEMLILQGVISVHGRALEVVPGGPAPGV